VLAPSCSAGSRPHRPQKLFFVTSRLPHRHRGHRVLWNLASFAFFRFFTGRRLGGEYTAINSTIQELVPARYRGRTDLIVNGSFWIGAALGAVSAIVLLDPAVIDPEIGWRLAFLTGAGLGLIVFVMRMWIPESPRWLMIHGRPERAHAIVDEIERSAAVERSARRGPLPTIALTAATPRCARSPTRCCTSIAAARWSGLR